MRLKILSALLALMLASTACFVACDNNGNEESETKEAVQTSENTETLASESADEKPESSGEEKKDGGATTSDIKGGNSEDDVAEDIFEDGFN